MREVVTRFAPSPTGRLHLGHAFAALFAHDAARAADGRFLLRIEDIDARRCRAEFVAGIFEDLAWLGLIWEEPVRRQSEHLADYAAALGQLQEMGVIYPCFCTRKDIAAEIERAGAAPHGPEGALYPGLCRHLSDEERRKRLDSGAPYALRLDVDRARRLVPAPLFFEDAAAGKVAAQPELLGDVVLARKDAPTSYHLAVTVDDAIQGVSLVTRGLDLFHATHIQRLLQALLGLPSPRYHHHPLLLDDAGRRFAKRDRAATLEALRRSGTTPQGVRRLIAAARRS
ncbi:MAG: tRNA glutamyl-Q(34) synthetase GluQRS [Proteobacteria bacterium]|nr:MAG: tRNA glutamyl-Q(34) synthetase GluQRS [Pseudomonadota bacterium]